MTGKRTKQAGTVRTVWEVWTYDVWGNADDGYEVNDRTCVDRRCVLYAPATIYNVGTDREFKGAYPSDAQIREVLGLEPDTPIDVDGDDLSIYVDLESDGYPVGELLCVSHDSLSPVGECKPEYREGYDGSVR